MIRAEELHAGYGRRPVLDGVRLLAGAGQVVGLIGPNGSGKTTLLRALYGALRPTAGLIELDGADLGRLTAAQIARGVAVVLQEGGAELALTVGEMVLLGRTPHRSSLQPWSATDRQVAAAALREVGLRELADRQYGTLSGGERQRALIARALAQQCTHLLLDEPTNHLDIRYQHEVLHLVRGLRATTVVVLHDLNLAARYCDSLVLLDRGRVVCSGPTSDVLHPAVLEPVYQVRVARRLEDGVISLTFSLPWKDCP